MQTVSGFIPGESYTVNFFQTVVRASSALDTSGSWAVYLDSVLIGVTAPTGTGYTFKSIILDWEFRSLSFTASRQTHTLKFLPMDDDSLYAPPFFNLNMGIDSLFIESNPVLDAVKIDLDGEQGENGVELKWWVEGNEGFDQVVLYRSQDGLLFKALGRVDAGAFLDTQPLDGLNFYRLSALHSGGSESHSNVVQIQFERAPAFAYHNHQLRQLHPEHGSPPWQLQLLDMRGNRVLKTDFYDHVDLGGIAAGMYVAQVSREGKGQSFKLYVE